MPKEEGRQIKELIQKQKINVSNLKPKDLDQMRYAFQTSEGTPGIQR